MHNHPILYEPLLDKQRKWWDSLSVEEKEMFVALVWDLDLKLLGICYSRGKYFRLYDRTHKRLNYGKDKESNA